MGYLDEGLHQYSDLQSGLCRTSGIKYGYGNAGSRLKKHYSMIVLKLWSNTQVTLI